VEPTIERWFPKAFLQSGSPVLDQVRAMIGTTPAEGFAASATALLDYDLRPDAPSIRVPTLLLAGSEDGILPASLRELQRLIPGSRYAEIPECGHLPQMQRPDLVIQEIESFLDGIPTL
jgi:3-oxoadipate enol-lactonase